MATATKRRAARQDRRRLIHADRDSCRRSRQVQPGDYLTAYWRAIERATGNLDVLGLLRLLQPEPLRVHVGSNERLPDQPPFCPNCGRGIVMTDGTEWSCAVCRTSGTRWGLALRVLADPRAVERRERELTA